MSKLNTRTRERHYFFKTIRKKSIQSCARACAPLPADEVRKNLNYTGNSNFKN